MYLGTVYCRIGVNKVAPEDHKPVGLSKPLKTITQLEEAQRQGRVLLWHPEHKKWVTGWVENFDTSNMCGDWHTIFDDDRYNLDTATYWHPLPGRLS